MTVTMQGYFLHNFAILLVMSDQVFVSAQNLQKVTLHGNSYILVPMKATKVPEVPF